MINSLYTGLSALMNYQNAIDVTGNNSANTSTAGFKASRVTFKSTFESMLSGLGSNSVGHGVGINTIDRDMSPGMIENTDVYSDLAITGEGFFIVGAYDSGEDGSLLKKDLYLTRVGKFDVLANQELVQGDLGLSLVGLPSDYDINDPNADIIPKNLPSIQEMLNMTAQQKAEYIDGLKPLELAKFSILKPKPSSKLDFFGTLNSLSGFDPMTFELTSASDPEVSYKVRFTFSRETQDLENFFSSEKSYTWKAEVIEWPSDTLKPSISPSTDQLVVSENGEILSLNNSVPDILSLDIGGEVFSLNKADFQSRANYTLPQTTSYTNIFDSKGKEQVLPVGFEKLSTGKWLFRPSADNPEIASISFVGDNGTYPVNDPLNPSKDMYRGLIDFTEGGYVSSVKLMDVEGNVIEDTPSKIIVQYLDGSEQEIELNFSAENNSGTSQALTLAAVPSSVLYNQNNGRPVGTLINISFDAQGNVIGKYSNQYNAVLARIPLIQLRSPEQLRPSQQYSAAYEFDPFPDQNTFNESSNLTGIFRSGEAGTGLIQTSALEYSNVNVAREMTKLIMYQRAMQLNARVITTADTILQEAAQLKR